MRWILVASPPRSGTTLLGRLVAHGSGGRFVGELDRVWEHTDPARRCGCGLALRDCPDWQPVLDHLPEPPPAGRRVLAAALLAVAAGRSTKAQERHAQAIRAVASALAASPCVVDTSKGLWHILSVPDATLVRIVRDPRAAVHSRARLRRARLARGTHANARVGRHTVLLAGVDTLGWMAHTLASRLIAWRRHVPTYTVTYAQLCAEPTIVIEAILAVASVPSTLAADAVVDLPIQHSCGGNAGRFDHGVTAIEEDTAWRTQMPRHERWIAAVALPLYAWERRSAGDPPR